MGRRARRRLQQRLSLCNFRKGMGEATAGNKGELKMPNTEQNADAEATAPKKTRKARAKRASNVGRPGYKQEAETLRVENERLRAKVARLESVGSSMESELIVDSVGGAYRDGLRTGLMLQGTK
jgi:hypothetical protein